LIRNPSPKMSSLTRSSFFFAIRLRVLPTLRGMTKAATILQVLATCLIGLMAGFFFAFSVDVAPAMRELDAQGYVATQQAINRAVRNVPFALVYFGAAIMPFVAALALYVAGRRRDAAMWLGVALVYGAGVFLLTREVNVPINNALALWNPQSPPAQWQQAREDWNAANLVRCLVACACFAVVVALPKRSAINT
jgi:uncharacterized membrane protein